MTVLFGIVVRHRCSASLPETSYLAPDRDRLPLSESLGNPRRGSMVVPVCRSFLCAGGMLVVGAHSRDR